MELINERQLIRGVADKWRRQYRGDKRDIQEKLAALDPETATAKDVFEIVGNDSWTIPPSCSECGAEASEIVQVGEEPDYESNTAYICGPCLLKACALMGV